MRFRALLIVVVGSLQASPALAFSLFPSQFGTPESALLGAARWIDGMGLEGGVSVGIEPGLIDAISPEPPTPSERAAMRAGIVRAFDNWENAVLQFDVTLDAAVTRDPRTGFEIDVMGLPASDSVWTGPTHVGQANPHTVFTTRTLSNGTVAQGWVITGADIYLNVELMRGFGEFLQLPFDQALGSMVRLMMHEIGHAIGLGHPNESTFYDTDFDPLNPMVLDPLDPYRDLVVSPNWDPMSIMIARPCPNGGIFCSFTYDETLHFDDIAGRDALYPVVAPEPAAGLLLLVGAIAARRRSVSSRR